MRPIDRILRAKRDEVEQQKQAEDLDKTRERIDKVPPPADFRNAIHVEGKLSLIAEIKRSSPSRGKIADISVAELARQYDNSPAAALSVLTDPHFEGDLAHIGEVKTITKKPVLRKDFIIDEYQVYQSRACGADAVLLIATFLEEAALSRLLSVCGEVGLTALVESHTAEDIAKIPGQAEVLGINNRNLSSQDLDIDTDTTEKLVPHIHEGKTIVCESGIFMREDVEKIEALERVNAILVGTSVISSTDPSQKIAELLGT